MIVPPDIFFSHKREDQARATDRKGPASLGHHHVTCGRIACEPPLVAALPIRHDLANPGQS